MSRSGAVTLRAPLRCPGYRRIWSSQLLSELGDWAARLALTSLVFARTDSAALAAGTYAATLLPWLGPGQWLAALADRHGRRAVMVTADLLRAVAFLALCVPMPVWGLLTVTVVAGLAAPPFAAARSAAIPDVVPPEQLGAAVTVSQLTSDVAIVTGNLVAGALLAVVGPVPALAVNSATFLASALLLRGLPPLVPPVSAGRQASARLALVAGARGLAADRPVAAAALAATAAAGAATAVESLVVPLSAAVTRQQAWLPGVVLAAISVVTVLATLASPTSGSPGRLLTFTLVLTPAGAALAAALLATAADASALAGMVLVGVLFVPLVTANVLLAPRIPAGQRASAFGLLMGGLAATQAGLAGLAGLLADAMSPGTAAAVVLCVPVVVGIACLVPIRQLRRVVETDSPAWAPGPRIEPVQSTAASVDDYLAELPPERREWVGCLRAACREELAGYDESMTYGMPSYGRNGTVEVSLASQQQYVALYVMRSDVLETHRDRLAGLSVGKSCIRYRTRAQVDLDVVRSMLAATAAGGGPVC